MATATKRDVKKAINSIVRGKGHFPTINEMCDILNFNPDQVRKCMGSLVEDGYLSEMGDWYKYNKNKFRREEEKISETVDHRSESLKILDDYLENADDIVIVDEDSTSIKEEIKNEIPIVENIKAIEDLKKLGISLAGGEPPLPTDNFKTLNLPKGKPGFLSEPWEYEKEYEKSKILDKIKIWFNNINNRVDKKNSYPIKKKKAIKPIIDENIENISGSTVYIIRLSMLAVGIGSIIISIYYNILEAIKYLPFTFAIIFSIMVVLFSVAAFETILLFLSEYRMRAWKKTIIVFGVSLLWISTAVISMSSTVAGRYTRYIQNTINQSKDISGFSAERFQWENLERQKTYLQQRISEKQVLAKQLSGIASSVKDIEARETHHKGFADTQWRISIIENDISQLDKKLSVIREKEASILEKNPGIISANISVSGVAADFYTWLSTIFNTSRDKIQFMISLAPAVFLDIISPVSIAIFLFLKSRKKGR